MNEFGLLLSKTRNGVFLIFNFEDTFRMMKNFICSNIDHTVK